MTTNIWDYCGELRIAGEKLSVEGKSIVRKRLLSDNAIEIADLVEMAFQLADCSEQQIVWLFQWLEFRQISDLRLKITKASSLFLPFNRPIVKSLDFVFRSESNKNSIIGILDLPISKVKDIVIGNSISDFLLIVPKEEYAHIDTFARLSDALQMASCGIICRPLFDDEETSVVLANKIKIVK